MIITPSIVEQSLVLLSPRLRNFRRKSGRLFNFSCPICGDSTKNPRKARGWIYFRDNTYQYYCHNCGYSSSAVNLIKRLDESLYRDMVLEGIAPKKKGDVPFEEVKWEIPKFDENPLKSLVCVSDLSCDDPVAKFVLKRMIPEKWHNDLYSCPDFFSFSRKYRPDKFVDMKGDEIRLLIPIRNWDSELVGWDGRSLGKSNSKYVKVMLDPNSKAIFGKEKKKIDTSKDIYIVEGQIDSMFLPNCIAACGDIINATRDLPKDKTIIIYDNEPRHPQTTKKIKRAIEQGYRVCLWPHSIPEKDINDMVLSKMLPYDIEKTIKENTFVGLDAEIMFNKWKKI